MKYILFTIILMALPFTSISQGKKSAHNYHVPKFDTVEDAERAEKEQKLKIQEATRSLEKRKRHLYENNEEVKRLREVIDEAYKKMLVEMKRDQEYAALDKKRLEEYEKLTEIKRGVHAIKRKQGGKTSN